MVVEHVRIENLAEADDALAKAGDVVDLVLAVVVRATVPAWLGAAVERAHRAGRSVIVIAEPLGDPAGEELAGWEIGVATAALAAGVDEVRGIDARRVERVRTVLGLLDAAAAHEVAP
ncbi:hypothetical protein [Aquihabitans sp. McL0605]|uniref:hypothetical protein n=1 Tax=Aquihabitans sp. McL0605 TaxID=3415671 RepID=UPI003CF4BEC0